MTTLIAFELLADRGHKPAALLMRMDQAQELPMALQPELAQLACRITCFGDRKAADQAQLPVLPVDQYLAAAPGGLEAAAASWLGGDWYMAPPAQTNGSQAASRALALQLVQLVAANADNHEIEAVLRRDATLSYHLLRLVNSLGAASSRKITSFLQAILVLGRAQLRRWLNLMLFSSRTGDARAGMLTARAAVRARMMELLARLAGHDKPQQEQAFMAGLFSLLGILFGLPLAQLMEPLAVGEQLKAALLRYEGELGMLLRIAETAEGADFPALAGLLERLRIGHDEFNLSLMQAHGWMADVIGVNGAAHA